MDGIGTMVIQNLDSLWFFSNVMVSINPQTPPSPLPKQKHNITISNNNQNANTNSPISQLPPTPKTPTNSHQNQQQPNDHNISLVPTSSGAPPLSRSSKSVVVDVEEINNTRDEGRSSSSKRKQRSKKGWNRVREIRRENNIIDWDQKMKIGSYSMEENDRVEIPLYKDEDAMKKHLKSWAVVVAYTAVHSSNPYMVAACS